jgi:REP element-mobilizing transposase RayT
VRYDPERHHRRSVRLKGYDYSQAGAYFITIVTQGRVCLFGEVVAGELRLNKVGRMVASAWEDLPNHYAGVGLDAFVVMPNHVHGIVVLAGPTVGAGSDVGAGLKPAPTLSEIVRAFKTFSARRINEHRGTRGMPVWQRNYYEHVVRDDESLDRIREYIAGNPLRWESDRENPGPSGARIEPQPARDEPWGV